MGKRHLSHGAAGEKYDQLELVGKDPLERGKGD